MVQRFYPLGISLHEKIIIQKQMLQYLLHTWKSDLWAVQTNSLQRHILIILMLFKILLH
jgi:hypothetical protein